MKLLSFFLTCLLFISSIGISNEKIFQSDFLPEEGLIIECSETDRRFIQIRESMDGLFSIYRWRLEIAYTLQLEDDSTLKVSAYWQDHVHDRPKKPPSDSLKNIYNTFSLQPGDMLKISSPQNRSEWSKRKGKLMCYIVFREGETHMAFEAFTLSDRQN